MAPSLGLAESAGLIPPDPLLPTVYPDDVVCRKSAPTVLGRVCCVPLPELGADGGASDVPTEAHVHWMSPDNADEMVAISGLDVLDRAILHGDLVTGADGRLGAARAPPHRAVPRSAARSRARLAAVRTAPRRAQGW
jgi:hypothetical protein